MADTLRIVSVIVAGTSYGLAVANLVVSFLVLSPKPFTMRHFLGSGGGFLWSHIVFVTIPFQGFVSWGIWEVVKRSGPEITFRPFALLILTALMSLGYAIIFRVELSRLQMKKVSE